MKQSSILILASALLAAAAAVSAEDSRKARFLAHDKNGDGKLSSDEFVAGHMAWFKQQDKDKNGTVELAENLDFQCGTGKARKAHKTCAAVLIAVFKKGDADQNGRHSAAERQAQIRGRHKKMDRDGDGFVTPSEFYTAGSAPAK